MAEALKVLADPARLQILQELARAEPAESVGVCDLARRLGISQPNVSHHLKVLKGAGFITCHRDQRYCYYAVDQQEIDALLGRVRAAIAPS
jgi:ArsR family transcriptional regulator